MNFVLLYKLSFKSNIKVQLNFSGPWENISILWQYLQLQLNKTLPNITLPDQFSITCPNPARDSLTLALPGGNLTQAPNLDTFFIVAARCFLRSSQNLAKTNSAPPKFSCANSNIIGKNQKYSKNELLENLNKNICKIEFENLQKSS